MLTCLYRNISWFGVDVNPKLQEPYTQMINDFDVNHIAKFMCCGAETVGEVNDYDALMTCPPYLDTEIYSESGAEHLSEAEFFKWWEGVVKSFKGKLIAIQTSQRCLEGFKDATERQGWTLIDKLDMRRQVSHFTRKTKKKYESMLVFRACQK